MKQTFQILDRALPPDRKSKPRRAVTVVLATLIGACVGVFLAFFREYLDTTVHSKEQVERLVGLPLLAAIPKLPALRKQRRRHSQEPPGPVNGSVPCTAAHPNDRGFALSPYPA